MGELRQRREIIRGGIPDRATEWRGALVHRNGSRQHRQGRPRDPRQRRHRRHHRTQAGRRTAEPAVPGSRSPRQERAGAGAVDRPADARRKREILHSLGRGPDQCAGAGAHRAVAVELARRRNQEADRRGARALCDGRTDRAVRPGNSIVARHRANGRPGPARTRHQFGQVRRPVGAVGPAVGRLGEPGRSSQNRLDGDRRAAGREAGLARVWHTKRDRQHRVATWRQSGIRLAARRPGLPPFRPAVVRPRRGRSHAAARGRHADGRRSATRRASSGYSRRGASTAAPIPAPPRPRASGHAAETAFAGR